MANTWWYVCTLCHRATPNEAESRAHKVNEHKLDRSANILILSQAIDLSPYVKLTNCIGPLMRVETEVKEELCDAEQLPQSADEDSELKWECEICPTRCPTQTHLKGHVLLHHAPVPAGAGDEEIKNHVNQEALPLLPAPAMPKIEVHGLGRVMDVNATRILRSRTFKLSVVLDPDGDYESSNSEAPNSGAEPNVSWESESDWTEEDEEQQNMKTRQGKPIKRRKATPLPIFEVSIDNSPTTSKFCGICYRPQKDAQELRKHVSLFHAKHLRNQESGAPCDCVICYQDVLLKPSASATAPGLFECKICNRLVAESTDTTRSLAKIHSRKFHPEYKLEIPPNCEMSEWRSAKEASLNSKLIELELPHSDAKRRRKFPLGTTIPIPIFEITNDMSATKSTFCGVCYQPQKNVEMLKIHVRMKHADHLRNQKRGLACDCKICYEDAFLRPSTTFAGMFECKICNHLDSQSTKCTIRKHVHKCHPEHKLENPAPNGQLSEWRKAKQDSLKMLGKAEPIQQPNSDGRYECTICNKTYAASSWRDHLDHHGEPEAIKTCPTCKQVFSSANYLKDHQMRVHLDNPRDHLCSTCGKAFKTAESLKKHSLLHDPANKIHKCDECGKTFFTKTELQTHNYKHADRTHLCPDCGKLFKSAMHLRLHQRTVHLGLRPLKCESCGEHFKTRLARNLHMAKHLDIKTMKCTLCPKMFKTKLQLSNHVHRVHRRTKKRFICQFCKKEFAGEASLGSHELEVHDHERIPGNRYECKHCDKKFMWESNLKSHEKLHSDERSNVCPEPGCDKKFKLGTHLYQHKFSHMAYEDLPLVCEVEGCGKRFGVIGQLRSHKQRTHGLYDKPKRRANAKPNAHEGVHEGG